MLQRVLAESHTAWRQTVVT